MIKVAIAGTGGVANGHAASYQLIKDCRLVAACDLERDRVEAFTAKHGIPAAYASFDEMLEREDVDAVSVCASDAAHAPLALAAIAAGKHVLCEKPLATSVEDARKMAAAAKRKGVMNMVNFSYRGSPAIQKAKRLVDEGRIGELRHFEASYLQGWLCGTDEASIRNARPSRLWRLSSRHSLGVLGDLGVHILDFATFPAGPVRRVRCGLKSFPKLKGGRLGEYVLNANDSAVVELELKSGVIGTVHTTRWAAGYSNALLLRLFGDKGTLEVDLDASWTTLRLYELAGQGKPRWKTLRCRITPNNIQRFLRSIRTGRPDQPDFGRGADIQALLHACIESDRTGCVVKV